MLSKDDISIRCVGLGKSFNTREQAVDKLKAALLKKLDVEEDGYWAVKNVDFEVRKGETVGVIGRNGSGKSTLLQLICGTLRKSLGQVYVNGRICALLELGSGFNPEFTGRENIEVNAMLLGLSRSEIKERMEDIIAFADIGEFIEKPVKTYSSGMTVRVAFAVLANISPDIMIIDEALAVGDELFQKKCFRRIRELKRRGTSMILVSHSVAQINAHCDRVVLMSRGNILADGEPHKITSLYQRLLREKEDTWEEIVNKDLHQLDGKVEKDAEVEEEIISESRYIYPSYGARIEDLCVIERDGEQKSVVAYGRDFIVRLLVRTEREITGGRVGIFISNKDGRRVGGVSLPNKATEGYNWENDTEVDIRVELRNTLWPGVYFIGSGISEISSGGEFLHRVVDYRVIRVAEPEQLVCVGETSLYRDLVKFDIRRVEQLGQDGDDLETAVDHDEGHVDLR